MITNPRRGRRRNIMFSTTVVAILAAACEPSTAPKELQEAVHVPGVLAKWGEVSIIKSNVRVADTSTGYSPSWDLTRIWGRNGIVSLDLTYRNDTTEVAGSYTYECGSLASCPTEIDSARFALSTATSTVEEFTVRGRHRLTFNAWQMHRFQSGFGWSWANCSMPSKLVPFLWCTTADSSGQHSPDRRFFRFHFAKEFSPAPPFSVGLSSTWTSPVWYAGEYTVSASSSGRWPPTGNVTYSYCFGDDADPCQQFEFFSTSTNFTATLECDVTLVNPRFSVAALDGFQRLASDSVFVELGGSAPACPAGWSIHGDTEIEWGNHGPFVYYVTNDVGTFDLTVAWEINHGSGYSSIPAWPFDSKRVTIEGPFSSDFTLRATVTTPANVTTQQEFPVRVCAWLPCA
jgi:hypothetical protein